MLFQDSAIPLANFTGTLRRLDKKSIDIDTPDQQILTFWRSRKTKFHKASKEIKPDQLAGGIALLVEASTDPRGTLWAVNVIVKVDEKARPKC